MAITVITNEKDITNKAITYNDNISKNKRTKVSFLMKP